MTLTPTTIVESSEGTYDIDRQSFIEQMVNELSKRPRGIALGEQKVQTPAGIRTVDAVWLSDDQIRALLPDVLPEMPEVCVEVLEPSDYLPLVITAESYVKDGAKEVWVIQPDGKRLPFEPRSWQGTENDFLHRRVDSLEVQLMNVTNLEPLQKTSTDGSI